MLNDPRLDGFNCPSLSKAFAQHRRTDTDLHREFMPFVTDGCRACFDAISRRYPRVHVGPLQNDKCIAVTINPRQQLSQLFVLALDDGAQPIDLVLLSLGRIAVAVQDLLGFHERKITTFVFCKHVALARNPLPLLHWAVVTVQTGSIWEAAP